MLQQPVFDVPRKLCPTDFCIYFCENIWALNLNGLKNVDVKTMRFNVPNKYLCLISMTFVTLLSAFSNYGANEKPIQWKWEKEKKSKWSFLASLVSIHWYSDLKQHTPNPMLTLTISHFLALSFGPWSFSLTTPQTTLNNNILSSI